MNGNEIMRLANEYDEGRFVEYIQAVNDDGKIRAEFLVGILDEYGDEHSLVINAERETIQVPSFLIYSASLSGNESRENILGENQKHLESLELI